MYEEICEKCKVTFFTPTQFKQHICAAPPPANDELQDLEREAIEFLDRKYSYQPFRASLAPMLTEFAAQVAARFALKEHDDLCGECFLANNDIAQVGRCERGAELQKAVMG